METQIGTGYWVNMWMLCVPRIWPVLSGARDSVVSNKLCPYLLTSLGLGNPHDSIGHRNPIDPLSSSAVMALKGRSQFISP